METRYDVAYEAQRIVEALKLEGATMTLMCALREAYDAGRANRPLASFYLQKNPDPSVARRG